MWSTHEFGVILGRRAVLTDAQTKLIVKRIVDITQELGLDFKKTRQEKESVHFEASGMFKELYSERIVPQRIHIDIFIPALYTSEEFECSILLTYHCEDNHMLYAELGLAKMLTKEFGFEEVENVNIK